MGNMLINVICFAITNGLNSALETLVSQCYGFGMFKMCGIYLNRGRAVVTAVFVGIAILLLCSDKILIGIGQDADIAIISKRYCAIMLPGIWAQT